MRVVSGSVCHFKVVFLFFAFYIPMKGLNVLSADLGQNLLGNNPLLPYALFNSVF